MLILGIDPGTAITGYGLVDTRRGREVLITYGVITTPAEMEMPLRLFKIQSELSAIINEFKPEAAAVEDIFYHRNAKTVITVAQARGVALCTLAASGIKTAEYTPLQVKQAVVGYGGADKKQVQSMVKYILKLDHIPRPDDAADALAVAICHAHNLRHINI
ncbi:Holliday junction endonuclease RuvC [Thermosyntropha lipolytica DSM 11003]|uniref:Crossover junction endodeoxyribonuclease RuvC n=1 Tax=Thermosyntropha lipolytica DSM 11003 TaxID=1123382 RepID=A0A1M5P9Z6_9FIRM|nr:crossover junction endodeoxyribonuclease RuvC [Thermosyntropha lipolytica]SHG98588.1 Holliday junction endonuclease RuvC [Thermosyntropha lipolytica DSM 11003]